MTEPLCVNVTSCARCGQDHEALRFRLLGRPIMNLTHFAACPITGEPVVMKITETNTEGHWSDGMEWRRLPDGSVRLRVRASKEPDAPLLICVVIPAGDWARLIAHLSLSDDVGSLSVAAALHGVEM